MKSPAVVRLGVFTYVFYSRVGDGRLGYLIGQADVTAAMEASWSAAFAADAVQRSDVCKFVPKEG